jgi:hypothetical protein
VTLIPVSDRDRKHGRTHFVSYALGWGLKDFYGYLHVGHGGSLQGMTTHFALMPELDMAVIALTNQASRASRAITSEILQAAATGNRDDWVEIYSSGAAQRTEAARQAVEEAFARRNAESSPSLPIAAYAGSYRDPWYGEVAVDLEDDRLVMRFSRSELLTGELEQASHRYQMINIKLDKSGGLTHGLEIARAARTRGLGLMVGSMGGTSLAMAPSFVVGLLCDFHDLDGPLLLSNDRADGLRFNQGQVEPPSSRLWG